MSNSIMVNSLTTIRSFLRNANVFRAATFFISYPFDLFSNSKSLLLHRSSNLLFNYKQNSEKSNTGKYFFQ